MQRVRTAFGLAVKFFKLIVGRIGDPQKFPAKVGWGDMSKLEDRLRDYDKRVRSKPYAEEGSKMCARLYELGKEAVPSDAAVAKAAAKKKKAKGKSTKSSSKSMPKGAAPRSRMQEATQNPSPVSK